MKYILILLCSITSLYGQPIAKSDTIYTKYNSVAFKPDTINFNLLKNDLGTGLKIIEFSINCTRYTSISTFKTIKNFGKIKLSNLGVGTFITTKYVVGTPIINKFVYTINDGKCGTSQGEVIICDSAYYYANSPYAWIHSDLYGWGYFKQVGSIYTIQYKGYTEAISKETYDKAIQGKP